MNMEKELTDLIEILEQQRKLAIKSSYKSGEYGYEQVKSFHIAINLLKDLKKRWIDSQKITLSPEASKLIKVIEENYPIYNDEIIQVV